MAAYAEGLNVLKHANAGTRSRDADAETRPVERPRVLPVRTRHSGGRGGVAARQRRRIWLLDLTASRCRLPRPRRVQRPGLRLGRRPMDRPRRDRRRRADAGAHRVAVRAVRVAGQRAVRGQDSSAPCARSSAATTRRRSDSATCQSAEPPRPNVVYARRVAPRNDVWARRGFDPRRQSAEQGVARRASFAIRAFARGASASVRPLPGRYVRVHAGELALDPLVDGHERGPCVDRPPCERTPGIIHIDRVRGLTDHRQASASGRSSSAEGPPRHCPRPPQARRSTAAAGRHRSTPSRRGSGARAARVGSPSDRRRLSQLPRRAPGCLATSTSCGLASRPSPSARSAERTGRSPVSTSAWDGSLSWCGKTRGPSHRPARRYPCRARPWR